MSILAGDLVILSSENMNDTDEGGGAATENIVIDGQSNNMFDDISTLDRTYGAVNLRKVFPAVRTQDDAKFYGSHVNIVKLPGDTKIGVNLFKTGDHFDKRVDAANRIENYRAQGGKYPAYLWGTQYAGAQVITVFQGESAQIPSAGDVLVLVKYPSELQQFIRISNVSSTLQTFTDTQGQFTRRIVVFEISSPLEMDFSGIEITRFDTTTPPTSIYKTTVANAARYYSARPLAVAGEIGDINVMVDTVYSQVVPSSQSQTPLIDLSAGSNAAPLIHSASGNVTINIQQQLLELYLGSSCTPGTLALTDHFGNAYHDVGGYVLDATTAKIGVIDYMSGVITFLSSFYAGSATYMPAVAPLVIADTSSIKVTDNNRSFVWTLNIDPPPQPGALSVSYMAMASWYELRDNGTGALLGQVAGIGTGSVNYTTGSVSVTFAALPDVGSEIIFAWGKKVDYINRAVDSGGAAITGKHIITKQLAHTGIDPASFDISWFEENAAVTRHIGSNSAGVLTGFGTGNLNVSTGLVTFTPSNIIPVGTVFTFAYNYGATGTGAAVVTKTLTGFDMTGNNVELNLGDTDIVAGSLSVEWAVPWGSSVPTSLPPGTYAELPVIASGTQQQADRDNAAGGFVGGRSATVNYTTGIVAFDWSIDLPLKMPLYNKWKPNGVSVLAANFAGYIDKNADLGNPTAFIVRYRITSGAALTAATETLQYNAAIVDLTPGSNDTIVPGSVMFDFGNKRYVDRAGSLFSDINPTTGAGTYSGTIDYGTGICNITGYSLINNIYTFTVLSALSTANFNPVDAVTFRTAVAPIKPSSFSIRAVQLHGGDQVTATANEAGVISTNEMFGEINQETGVVKVRFGKMVTAAGNESQPWYDPDNVVSGQIFEPKPVLASTIVYNAVSFTFIPLDKDILGLDSVRLPVDGRIPVYRKGDVVVVLNDQTHTGTYTSSTTTNLGRVRLAKVTVKDLGGTLLNAAKWSVDLDTGVITWGDLSGVSQPLTITDRIEDMAVVADVEITGKVKLSEPLSHDFPATSTLVSNAVVYGDLFAYTSTPFDQQTWVNTWLDYAYGNTVPAEYNHAVHPITVTNLGAIEQRWAIIFVTSSTFNVVGEHVGQIVSGHSIATDLEPINPGNNDPYFTLDAAGWGAGWSAGNVLRFNTYAAKAPLWVVQSIGQGDPTDTDYGFCLELRGDVDSV
jgi:hypothetical protein